MKADSERSNAAARSIEHAWPRVPRADASRPHEDIDENSAIPSDRIVIVSSARFTWLNRNCPILFGSLSILSVTKSNTLNAARISNRIVPQCIESFTDRETRRPQSIILEVTPFPRPLAALAQQPPGLVGSPFKSPNRCMPSRIGCAKFTAARVPSLTSAASPCGRSWRVAKPCTSLDS